jgi:hypothetical protein
MMIKSKDFQLLQKAAIAYTPVLGGVGVVAALAALANTFIGSFCKLLKNKSWEGYLQALGALAEHKLLSTN